MAEIKQKLEDTKNKIEHKAYELKGEAKGRLKQMKLDAEQRSSNEQ